MDDRPSAESAFQFERVPEVIRAFSAGNFRLIKPGALPPG
jgi:hypothetical protein